MIKSAHSLLPMIFIMVLTGNAASASLNMPQIPIFELLTIGDEAEAVIYQWVGLATDPQGNIYLTDLKDFSLKKFDRRGKFIKKTGARGQGPGEFQGPGKIRFFQGSLFVAEIQNPGLQRFDSELNFQEKLLVEQPFTDFQIINNSTLAAATLNSQNLVIYDHKGKQVKKVPYTRKASFMLNSVNFCWFENAYYLSYKWQDTIFKITGDGDPMWGLRLFRGRKNPLKSLYNVKVPRQIVYKTIAADNQGKIYVLGGDWSTNPSRNIYILSSQGRKIGIITLPEATHTFHIDRENHLFVRSAYGTQVKKYRVGQLE